MAPSLNLLLDLEGDTDLVSRRYRDAYVEQSPMFSRSHNWRVHGTSNTAAHSGTLTRSRRMDSGDLMLIAGEHRMGVAEPGAQQSGVAAVARHPGFDPTSMFHDQAVLRLSEPLTLGGSVGTLCLPEGQPGPAPPQQDCVATGWGLKALKGKMCDISHIRLLAS